MPVRDSAMPPFPCVSLDDEDPAAVVDPSQLSLHSIAHQVNKAKKIAVVCGEYDFALVHTVHSLPAYNERPELVIDRRPARVFGPSKKSRPCLSAVRARMHKRRSLINSQHVKESSAR